MHARTHKPLKYWPSYRNEEGKRLADLAVAWGKWTSVVDDWLLASIGGGDTTLGERTLGLRGKAAQADEAYGADGADKGAVIKALREL